MGLSTMMTVAAARANGRTIYPMGRELSMILKVTVNMRADSRTGNSMGRELFSMMVVASFFKANSRIVNSRGMGKLSTFQTH